ncbi:copper resistance D family protein [Amycolatopsis alkalitolerans]|uniref:Copper resistance protein CopD n=1 Tax=Amycolatopsis alkalitolerans TaxID=2547244 RepID=A0A5C4M415_9PSEU|nr:CopD family protein [Amycolatopsis alkalitolerans]TNC27337.1 copper resistance protein CopD [Amycolatopsis alkalitolerans]
MSRAGATAPVRYSTLVATVTAALAGVLIGVALTTTAPVPGVANAGAVVSVAIPVVRVLLDLAAVITVGLCLLPVLVGYDRPKLTEPVLARARLAAFAAALVWAIAAVATLVLQTAEYRARTIGFGDIWDYVVHVGAGTALLAVAVLALAHAGVGMLALRHGEKVPAELRAGLGLFALLPLPVTGHASDWAHRDYTMISIELHVMSAVAWTGGLGAMAALLIGNRTLLARALPRFSKLATLCLALSVVTGLVNAGAEILLDPATGFWTALLTTAYGWLVLLKVLCAIVIGLLGATLRWRLLPRIVRHERTALATWASLELTTMGLAFGLAVVLTRAPIT